jgi:hypothetical protein
MNQKFSWMMAGVCALALLALSAAPAHAQDSMMKDKAPMYSYVGNWALPRAQWAAMDKANADDDKAMDKAMADGLIVGHGYDTNLVHSVDGMTHDSWWSSMSMGGLMTVDAQGYKNGTAVSPVLQAATAHNDFVLMSRHYNWKSGAYKGAYVRGAMYTLKPDAPDNAVNLLSNSLFVPLMEKLMADGAIIEYEVDTEAVHTTAPGTFWVIFVTPTADGLDKFNMALMSAIKAEPLGPPAFDSMVDYTKHRDFLEMGDGAFK